MSESTPGIFLSYASGDREQARQVVSALETLGYAVWWDRELLAGDNYQRKIEAALDAACSVVVLWTPQSVASDWVREEASLARDRNKLVPARLEDCEIPPPFRLLHTIGLQDWDGDSAAPAFQELAKGIDARCHALPPVRLPQPQSPNRTRYLWVILPTAILALLALALLRWPAPAHVEVEAVASRVFFETANRDRQTLFHTTARSVSLRGFDSIRLTPVSVSIARTPGANPASLPESGWKPIHTPAEWWIKPAARHATVHLLFSESAPSWGVAAAAAEVTLQTPEPGSLQVEVAAVQSPMSVPLPDQFLLVCDNCLAGTDDGPDQPPSRTYRVRVSADARLLEFQPSKVPALLDIGVAQGEEDFSQANISLRRIEFLDQDGSGQAISTIRGPGFIRYREPPGIAPVDLAQGHFLRLEDLDRAYLHSIAFGEKQQNLRLKFSATAGKLSSGFPPEQDRRLSQLDVWWHSPSLNKLYVIVGWAVASILAILKLRKDKVL